MENISTTTIETVERAIAPELFAISVRGIEALKIQLKQLGYVPGDFFYVKVNSNIPYKCFVNADYTIQIMRQRAAKKENGEFILNESGNKTWVNDKLFKNGFGHLAGVKENVYILPNVQVNGIQAKDTKCARTIFCEIDDRSIEEQRVKINEFYQQTGLEPCSVVFSGGKSLHIYYRLTTEVSDVDTWKRLQGKLIAIFKSDPRIINFNREMRLAGVHRTDKGKDVTLEYYSDAAYSVEDIEARLDSSGMFPHGMSKARWSKYISLRGKNASDREILSLLSQPEDELIQKPQVGSVASSDFYPRFVGGNSTLIPLEKFLSRAEQETLASGISAGNGRNPTAHRLACKLVARAKRLDELEIKHTNDARALIEQFCSRCIPSIVHECDRVFRNAEKATDTQCEDKFFLTCAAVWMYENNREEWARIYKDPNYKKPYHPPQPKAKQSQNQGNAGSNEQQQQPESEYDRQLREQLEPSLRLDIPARATRIHVAGQNRISDEQVLLIPEVCLLILKLGMGAGKTTLIKKIKDMFPGRDFLSISSIISLSRQICAKLGLKHREDLGRITGLSEGEVMGATNNIALVAPSLYKFIGEDGKPLKDNYRLTVILDEIVEILDFMLQSSLCNKKNRRALHMAALTSFFRFAHENKIQIICSDANLTNIELTWILSLLPSDFPICAITGDWKGKHRDVVIYRNEGDGVDFEEVEQDSEQDEESIAVEGLPVASKSKKKAGLRFHTDLLESAKRQSTVIYSDSQADLEAFDKLLAPLGGNILRTDRTTTGHKIVQEFFLDPPRTLAKYDIQHWLTSPTCNSGTDVRATEEMYAAYRILDAAEKALAEAKDQDNGDAIAKYSCEIEEAKAQIDYWDLNWEKGTPKFKEAFGINKHLAASKFVQLCGRDRHNPPLKIWLGNHVISLSGCKSSLWKEQLKNISSAVGGLEFLLAQAKQYLGFAPNDDVDSDVLEQTFKTLRRNAEEGLNPHLIAHCQQRAKYCANMKDRVGWLKSALQEQGHTVKILYVDAEFNDKAGSDFEENVTDYKITKLKEHSKLVVAAPIITKEEAEKLSRKADKTPEEQVLLERFYLEAKYPELLEKLEFKEIFYHYAFTLDKEHWLNGVALWWEWKNRDKVFLQDSKKFVHVLKNFAKSSIEMPHDFLKLHSGILKFVEDWGLFEVLEIGKTYTSTDLLPLLKKIRYRKREEGIVGDFFNAKIPDKAKETKLCIPFFNRILDRFNLHLNCKKSNGKKTYTLSEAKLPKDFMMLLNDIRQTIEESLDLKFAPKSQTADDEEWKNFNLKIDDFLPDLDPAEPKRSFKEISDAFVKSMRQTGEGEDQSSIAGKSTFATEIQAVAKIEAQIAQEITPEQTPVKAPEIPQVPPEVALWKNRLRSAKHAGFDFAAQAWVEFTGNFDAEFIDQVLDEIALFPEDIAFFLNMEAGILPEVHAEAPAIEPQITKESVIEIPEVSPEVTTWKNCLRNAKLAGNDIAAKTWQELTSTSDDAFKNEVIAAIALISPSDAEYFKAGVFIEDDAPISAEFQAETAACRNVSCLKNILRNAKNAGFEIALNTWNSLKQTELAETIQAVLAVLSETNQEDYKYYQSLHVPVV